MASKKKHSDLERAQKANWLSEHLPYELKMLRHSRARILILHLFYLDWNMALASYAVAATNLAAFLTNAEKKGNNFQAKDFVSSFRSRKGDLASTFAKLEPQVFHLGKSRPKDSADKFDNNDVEATFEWVEKEMASFIAALSDEDREIWRADLAVPEEAPPLANSVSVDSSMQTASSASPQVFGTPPRGKT